MIIWLNGAFGAGKTTVAFELYRRLDHAFVYDPENVGYFIRKNAPADFSKGDFQDIPLWREMNYRMLKLIAGKFDGIIIVPMTLVNPGYYHEIITKLTDDGIDIMHFILYADKPTILKRLKRRSLGRINRERFAVNAVDRCIYAFEHDITDNKIITDDKKIDDIVREISDGSGLALTNDRRTAVRKWLDKHLTVLRHIR